MDEEAREAAYEELTTTEGVVWAVSVIDNHRIDEINILQATMEGMRESLHSVLDKLVDQEGATDDGAYAFIDGNRWVRIAVE